MLIASCGITWICLGCFQCGKTFVWILGTIRSGDKATASLFLLTLSTTLLLQTTQPFTLTKMCPAHTLPHIGWGDKDTPNSTQLYEPAFGSLPSAALNKSTGHVFDISYSATTATVLLHIPTGLCICLCPCMSTQECESLWVTLCRHAHVHIVIHIHIHIVIH